MPTPSPRARLTALLVPPATIFILLYHSLVDLQITIRQPEVLWLIAGGVGVGLVLGLIAALGGHALRTLVFACVAVLWVDMVFPVPSLFEPLMPAGRALRIRDQKRLQDIQTIQKALEAHIAQYGRLPSPSDYGEQMGPADFWHDWWDVSGQDEDADGVPFLDFLVDSGVLLSVPVDPINHGSDDGHPASGSQYVYFVVPAGYVYRGGQCQEHQGYSTYLLGITDLERESERPLSDARGSGCDCLWRDNPNFFQQHFDYVLCGRFRP